MPGILAEITSIFGDDKSLYDILNIKNGASKDEVKYCSILDTVQYIDVTKHRTAAKYRSWVLVKCVWCGAYYWSRLRKGTGYGFHDFLTCILLLLLLIQCKIPQYLGPVRTVRCFVTTWKHVANNLGPEFGGLPTPVTYRLQYRQDGTLYLYRQPCPSHIPPSLPPPLTVTATVTWLNKCKLLTN